MSFCVVMDDWNALWEQWAARQTAHTATILHVHRYTAGKKKKHMVFLRLHHVKSLTFHFASSIFPFLTLSSLGIQERKDAKQKTNKQKKTSLNFAPLHLWNNSCVNKSSRQSNECVTRAVSVGRPCKLEPLCYLELRLTSLSEEFRKILTKYYRLKTIQTTELKGNELEHVATITLFHCVCLFLI